jgi:hypothetical protein
MPQQPDRDARARLPGGDLVGPCWAHGRTVQVRARHSDRFQGQPLHCPSRLRLPNAEIYAGQLREAEHTATGPSRAPRTAVGLAKGDGNARSAGAAAISQHAESWWRFEDGEADYERADDPEPNVLATLLPEFVVISHSRPCRAVDRAIVVAATRVERDSPASLIEKILRDQTVKGNLVGLV